MAESEIPGPYPGSVHRYIQPASADLDQQCSQHQSSVWSQIEPVSDQQNTSSIEIVGYATVIRTNKFVAVQVKFSHGSVMTKTGETFLL